MNLPSYLQQEKSGALLVQLWVQPNASRSGWGGLHGRHLKIRLKSPPQNGQANRELINFLSSALTIPKSSIELIRGQSSRNKIVRITGLTVDQLLALVPKS